MIAVAKGLRGYLPLAATVATEEIPGFSGPFMEYKPSSTVTAIRGTHWPVQQPVHVWRSETENTLEAIHPRFAFWPSALQRRLRPFAHVGEVRRRLHGQDKLTEDARPALIILRN
jgi:hypothetical protein